MVAVPNNWKNYFQPLDISVNKPCKDFLRNEAQQWYSNEIAKQVEAGKKSHEVKVDVRITVVRPLHAKWVIKFYDYIRSKPDIVISGWKRSKIFEYARKKIQLDPFS